MAKYVSPATKKRAKKNQTIRKIAMYLSLVAAVLLIALFIVQVIKVLNPPTTQPPLIVNSGESAPTDTPPQTETPKFTPGPKLEEKDLDILAPTRQLLDTAENGRVSMAYFKDAAFIGDSLADGFREYQGTLGLYEGTLFFTARSLTPRAFLQPGFTMDFGGAQRDPWEFIKREQCKKVYITIGTNALAGGQSPRELAESYGMLVDKVRESTPDAVIYISTITPTLPSVEKSQPNLSKDRIERTNTLLVKMAAEKGVALLDIHSEFSDENGYLIGEKAYGDGIHLRPSGYKEWMDHLISHTVYSPTSPYIPGSPYITPQETEGN